MGECAFAGAKHGNVVVFPLAEMSRKRQSEANDTAGIIKIDNYIAYQWLGISIFYMPLN